MIKLTKPQLETLREACRPQGVIVSDSYRPREKLLIAGLVEQETGKFGHMTLFATDTGRAALAIV